MTHPDPLLVRNRSRPRQTSRILKTRGLVRAVALAVVAALSAACGSDSAPSTAADGEAPGGTVRLYTSYTQDVVDGLLAAYREAEPNVSIELFRAPTGQLNARIAAEQRSGGIEGDVLLVSDPLSMQQYADQDVLRSWTPPDEDAVPQALRTDTFWAVTTSDVVVVSTPGRAPQRWEDLTDPQYRDAVALPDPGFAGSAFGALGYFALADEFGFDYYQRLKDNGAVQVQAPDDVITGVAEGRFLVGMTLGFSARAAMASGSPIEISSPEPGAVQLYAPVAVFADTANPTGAESFANFLLTAPAQEALSSLGRTPVRSDVQPPEPAGPQVVPDWAMIFAQQAELLASYRAVFGG